VLILPVLLFAGVSTLSRMAELERQDGELVQGLNRLRHLRVEMDPEIEPYLVTSKYDDPASLLGAYGSNSSRLHGLWVLTTLIGVMVAFAGAILVAVAAVLLGLGGGAATVIGVLTFLGIGAALGAIAARSFASAMRSIKTKFPAPAPNETESSDRTGTVP
jgi:hypothetical protein